MWWQIAMSIVLPVPERTRIVFKKSLKEWREIIIAYEITFI